MHCTLAPRDGLSAAGLSASLQHSGRHRAWKRRRSKTGSSSSSLFWRSLPPSPPLRPSEEEGSPIHDWGLTLPRLTEGGGGGGRMMKGKIFSFSSPLLFLSAAGEKRGGRRLRKILRSSPRAQGRGRKKRSSRGGGGGRWGSRIEIEGGENPHLPYRTTEGGIPATTFAGARGGDFLACKMRWRRGGAKKTKNKETGRRRRPSMRMHVFCELQRFAPRDPPLLPKWRNYWLRNISFP